MLVTKRFVRWLLPVPTRKLAGKSSRRPGNAATVSCDRSRVLTPTIAGLVTTATWFAVHVEGDTITHRRKRNGRSRTRLERPDVGHPGAAILVDRDPQDGAFLRIGHEKLARAVVAPSGPPLGVLIRRLADFVERDAIDANPHGRTQHSGSQKSFVPHPQFCLSTGPDARDAAPSGGPPLMTSNADSVAYRVPPSWDARRLAKRMLLLFGRITLLPFRSGRQTALDDPFVTAT